MKWTRNSEPNAEPKKKSKKWGNFHDQSMPSGGFEPLSLIPTYNKPHKLGGWPPWPTTASFPWIVTRSRCSLRTKMCEPKEVIVLIWWRISEASDGISDGASRHSNTDAQTSRIYTPAIGFEFPRCAQIIRVEAEAWRWKSKLEVDSDYCVETGIRQTRLRSRTKTQRGSLTESKFLKQTQ
jgi:hypothetical protein